MPLNLNPYKFVSRSGRSELATVNPYVRLSQGLVSVFVQDGKFYSEGGPEIPYAQLPDWVEAQLATLSPQARRSCGLAEIPGKKGGTTKE